MFVRPSKRVRCRWRALECSAQVVALSTCTTASSPSRYRHMILRIALACLLVQGSSHCDREHDPLTHSYYKQPSLLRRSTLCASLPGVTQDEEVFQTCNRERVRSIQLSLSCKRLRTAKDCDIQGVVVTKYGVRQAVVPPRVSDRVHGCGLGGLRVSALAMDPTTIRID